MKAMPMYRSVAQADPEVMRAAAQRFRDQGYRRFRIKVGIEDVDDIIADLDRALGAA